jgi:PHD/YefM family antitoxin component YafN of YafNO toxin-antitoxin module
MSERVKTGEVRQRLGDLLDRMAKNSDAFVIERRGKPMAALVPFVQYERLQRAAELELTAMLDRHAQRLTRRQAEDLARGAVDAARRRRR